MIGQVPSVHGGQIQDRRRAAVENARRDRKAITMMVRKWLKEDEHGKSVPGNA